MTLGSKIFIFASMNLFGVLVDELSCRVHVHNDFGKLALEQVNYLSRLVSEVNEMLLFLIIC